MKSKNEFEITGDIDFISNEYVVKDRFFKRDIVIKTDHNGKIQLAKIVFNETNLTRNTILYTLDKYKIGEKVTVNFSIVGSDTKNGVWTGLSGNSIY